MKYLLTLSALLMVTFSAHADWELNNEKTSVNFISIKKSTAGEIHKFNMLSGSINENKVRVSIDLSSVETNIPIRNDRMKSMLFEVVNFSSAEITTTIDKNKLDNLKTGESYQKEMKLQLSLHGKNKDISSLVQVTKQSDNSVLVYSIHPVIINAADYNLSNGIEKLRKVAKLPSISAAVPVTFNLVFNKKA